ncbi:hypothetical protein acdb102_28520 [Acidothermaceae bacterium B102]|nr:hypothetical protein acdb102_28520 [Acidothermaceae bacterium B102]
MTMRRGLMTWPSALCASLLLLVATSGTSNAALAATSASATQTVGSASWSAILSNGTTGSGALPESYVLGGVKYFNLVNTGTSTLTPARYTLTYSITGPNLGIGWIDLQVCAGGTWNETVHTCSGTIDTLATTGATAITSPAPQPSAPGAVVRARAIMQGVNVTALIVLGVSVTPTNAGGVTTSS